MHPATRRQLAGLGVLLAVAIAGTLMLSPARVVDGLEALGDRPVVFVIGLAALYLLRSLFLWPVTFVSVLLGYLYDPWLAVPAALTGAALTGVVPFLVARQFATGEGPFGAVGDLGDRATGSIGAFRGVVVARLVPIPTDAVSYAAGLSKVSLWTFVVGTGVGELPWTLLAVAAGDSMRTLSVEGFSVEPTVVIGLLGLAIVLLAGPVYRWGGVANQPS
ncbi:MAG: VTT domain-containing protein [Haloarculaceae archaeon]